MTPRTGSLVKLQSSNQSRKALSPWRHFHAMRSNKPLILVLTVLTLAAFGASPAAAACTGQSCLGKLCTICGTNAADTLFGTSSANVICGFDGHDTINAGSGNDTICGGLGNDDVEGESGMDTIAIEGGTDTIDGGAGSDTMQCTAACTADLGAPAPQVENDTLASIENANGSSGNDSLFGDSGNNTLNGQDGDDLLDGDDGNDILKGSNGIDTLRGQSGADVMDCGAGIDKVSYLFSQVGVTVDLGTGVGPEGDTLANCENVWGSSFADNLTGNSSANSLYGFGGVDFLDGAGGTDTCDGGVGPPPNLGETDFCANCETAVSCDI